MNGFVLAAPLVAGVFAGISGGVAARQIMQAHAARSRAKAARQSSGLLDEGEGGTDLSRFLVSRAERTSRSIAMRPASALSPSVRARRASSTRAAAFMREHALPAGCEERISIEGYCETRARLALAGLAVGGIAGCVFSGEMAVVLALAGGVAGWFSLRWAVRSLERERALEAEERLSEMLEVVALGLRSGLTFDKSFYLYGSHFDSGFARSCVSAYERWSMGLMSRDDALRRLARSYSCDELGRAVETMVRSLRFGSAFAEGLEEIAAQSRAGYRARLEERVAKAPVKMMLPTGTLILPAMLLLVMGPILLELGQGF